MAASSTPQHTPARVGLSAASALLFFPTALVALGYSLAAARQHGERADRLAATAQVWRRITVVLGVLVYLVVLVTLLALGAFSSPA